MQDTLLSYTKLDMMLKRSLVVLALLFTMEACRPHPDNISEPKTSREARSLMGAAEDFTPDLLAAIDESRLSRDWSYQQGLAWALWADANQIVKRERADFAKWQTWYSKEDLQGIFRAIYSALSKDQRAGRVALSDREINDGIRSHTVGQFLSPDWNRDVFERWFVKYDNDAKKLSIPGMNKVLMNHGALVFFLKNYAAIDRCAKAMTLSEACEPLTVPPDVAFLKTAWRRGQTDFLVPYYQTDDLFSQLAADEWQVKKREIPEDGTTYRIDTPSGQVFHLTAVHLTLKLTKSWFWTSIWLDEKKNGEGAVRLDRFHPPVASQSATAAVALSSPWTSAAAPGALAPIWQNYRLCAVNGFDGLAKTDSSVEFERTVAGAEANVGASWCSNPYLEGGAQNHKTNCIGCHQHAGSAWSQDEFNEHLLNDLASVTQKAVPDTVSSSDFIWSLYNGPEPFASFISQEIDYFDIYDSF